MPQPRLLPRSKQLTKQRLKQLPSFLQLSDLQGLAQLVTDGVLGITGIAQSLHGTVLKTIAKPLGPLRHWVADVAPGANGIHPGSLTGRVYGGVRAVARLASGSAGLLLAGVAAPLAALRQRSRPIPTTLQAQSAPLSAAREAFISALNGVLGDHLVRTRNSLAIRMAFRVSGQGLTLTENAADNRRELARLLPAATDKIVLLVHGLCMNDLHWNNAPLAADSHTSANTAEAAQWAGPHAQALVQAHGYTPVMLHYNTGLAIADNGRQLSALLEQLVQAWPQPVQSLAIVAHSMGGLVARSSCYAADKTQPTSAKQQKNKKAVAGSTMLESKPLLWRSALQHLVFLGTPHQGAPLEQLGRWVDGALGQFRFTRPFARIGKIRSRGIGDLRVGCTTDDGQRNLVLPPSVACFAIAASLSADDGKCVVSELFQQAHDRLLGDGLVPVGSALGHATEAGGQSLAFVVDNTVLLPETGHLALLTHPAVTAQLVQWL